MSPPYKGIQDSLGVWIPRCGFRILDTGFQIFNSGIWIPDSNCLWDPGFLELYFGFRSRGFRYYKRKFTRFRYSMSKNLSQNPDSLTFISHPSAIYLSPSSIDFWAACGPIKKWVASMSKSDKMALRVLFLRSRKGGINFWGGGGYLLFDHEISIHWKPKQVFFIIYTRFRRSYKLSIEHRRPL